MDDLIAEFLDETNESLDNLDADFIALEQNPEDKSIIGNIFRVMHTVKGTCGFLGLERLEQVAHAAEDVMDKVRDGEFQVDPPIISLILEATDRIQELVQHLEAEGEEPQGDDSDLIERLRQCAATGSAGEGGQTAADEASADGEEVQMAEGRKTPDLDEEIDFEPVKAPSARGNEPSEIVGEDIMSKGGKTPDLDEEIDFEPVKAPAAKARQAEPIAEPSQEAAVADVGANAARTAESGAKKPPAQTIRVGLDVLEDLMQMVGELVLTRNQLMQVTRNDESIGPELNLPLQKLNQITSELQEGVVQTRMQPIGNAWNKFPRLIRDLSLELGKKIELEMVGEDTELDRQMLEAIKDPLTHMVRNSVDHGLETPDEREAAGKQPTGKVRLSAYHEGGHIAIKISDDGRGLNLERIKQKAIENGLTTAEDAEGLNDKQIAQFIFKAGFSTADKVTEVSGRGVGMDVVMSNISKIGGHIEVNTKQGKGSEFLIHLPLTLAIMQVLIFECEAETFAIPQIRVSEIVRALTASAEEEQDNDDHVVETINGAPVLRLRGRLLPLVSLSQIFQPPEADLSNEAAEAQATLSEESSIIICEVGAQSFGIIVDRVCHTEEIVVKPLSSLLSDLSIYSGCTILGDGGVIMIIDPKGILDMYGTSELENALEDDASRADKDAELDNIEHFLFFRAWTHTPYAVPLELVDRLEEVEMEKAEWSGSRKVVQYRGGLMHLIMLDDATPMPESGKHSVIVFSDDGHTLGLVVEEISDIVKQPMDIKSAVDKPGLLGSMVMQGATTDLIDISHFLSNTFTDWLTQPQQQSQGDGEAAAKPSGKEVLLVDDSPFFRKFMTPVLTAKKLEVVSVESAEDAIRLLEQSPERFAVILSDIDMPDMDGLEFTRYCKSQESLKHIPIVALTSHRKEQILQQHEDPGFSAFVSKSERDRVADVIQQCISAGSSLEEVNHGS